MVKEKRILSYFIGWLIIGFIVCFVGIIKTYALTWNDIGYINDNSDISIEVSYETESNTLLNIDRLGEYYTQIKALYINVSNYTFIADRHYLLELSLPMLKLTNANYYEVYDANNNKCKITNVISSFDSAYPNWEFQCNNTTDNIIIKVYNTNNQDITQMGTFRWNYAYLRYSDTPINNTNEEIADNIINNQNQNTQDIINNNNQNTQDIIDSNKETQEVIKDQFNDCRDSVNLLQNVAKTQYINGVNWIVNNDGSIYVSGTATGYSAITIGSAEINSNMNNISISGLQNTKNIVWTSIYLYDSDNNRISDSFYEGAQRNFTINLNDYPTAKRITIGVKRNNNDKVSGTIYPQVQKGNNFTSYEQYGKELCSNKIDETNDKLNGIQGALTDSSTPNMDILGDSAGWLPPGPLDVVINLPLTMMNNLLSSLGRSCSKLRVNLPFVNKNLEIPCISELMEQMGALSLWQWTGRIASVLILYSYLMNLYGWADKVLTLRAEFDEAMGADLANWGRL